MSKPTPGEILRWAWDHTELIPAVKEVGVSLVGGLVAAILSPGPTSDVGIAAAGTAATYGLLTAGKFLANAIRAPLGVRAAELEDSLQSSQKLIGDYQQLKAKVEELEITRPQITLRPSPFDQYKYGILVSNDGAPAVFNANLTLLYEDGTPIESTEWPLPLYWERAKSWEAPISFGTNDYFWVGSLWFHEPGERGTRRRSPASTLADYHVSIWERQRMGRV